MKRLLLGFLIYAVAAVGQLHLPVLQVVAWAGMLAAYSSDAGFTAGVRMTFDGDHPCPMCKAIEAEKASRNPDNLDASTAPPVVMITEPIPAWIHPPRTPSRLPSLTPQLRYATHPPALPPPRTRPV